MTNLVGTTLGQYQIVELIGEGGMASVYKAWQASLRRYVALKVLATHLSSDAEFVQRFHQEAVSAANLKHTSIVTIHDVGTESGYHYIAMEFIEGASLEERIRSGQAFTLEQVVGVISQVGSALDYAHQRGFIHRDIKPANILIDASGRTVLTDFGIVKALSGSGVTSPLTRAGTVFGTPHYMSPEQIRDEPLDHRSDLYSLGIVCYEMLSGQVPFDGTTTHAILYAQVNTPPPPLRKTLGPAAPAPVEAVVGKMLAKERENRYNSGGGFARDLAQAVSGIWPAGVSDETGVTTPMGTGTAVMGQTPAGMPAPTVVQPAQPPTPPPVSAPRRRRRWPLVLGALAVVAGMLLIAGAAVIFLGNGDPLKSVQTILTLKSAQTALDDGDYAKAVDEFSQVLENDPDNVEAIDGQLEAAAYWAQAGHFDAAITAYETVWQAKPGEIQALQGLGQAYEAKGEWEEAAVWYERWTQAAPEDGNSFLALGSARFNLGENEGTVAEYQRAVELGAGSPEMDVHLGLAYFELGYYDKAVEWLQSGVSQNPEDFQLRRALGVSLYAHGQPEQAVEHLNKAITLGTDRPDDEMVDIYYALGGCYFEKQDYEQAIGFYAQAQELDPEGQAVWADEARANLDEAYLELGQSVMKEALLDLDFANIVTEGDETYAVAKTGQAVKIEGAVHLVDGPRAGSQALVVEEGTSNECQNPTFETDANHWSSASLGSVARTTQDARYGDASLQCFSGEGQSYMQGSYSGGVPAFDTSVDYVVSAWYKLEDLPPGGNVRFMAYWMGGSHSDVSANVTVGASEADGWHQVSAVLTPDYNDRTDAGFYMRIEGATADGQSFLLDGFQIERGQDYPTSYCDGDQGDGYSWSGTPHASISTRTATTVSLDDHVGLISRNETSSFRIVAQMPYDADVAWPSTLAYLLDAAGDDDTHKRIILGYSSTKDRFEGFIHGGTRITTAPQTFRAGDWLEFVLTLDFSSNSYNLYINGELAGSSTENLAVESLTEWVLGSVYVGTSNWGGLAFSDFTVFDTLLTADEVTALYRTNSSASE